MKNKQQGDTLQTTEAVGLTETDKRTKTFMKTMNDQEVWTDAFNERFGERVCVLVGNGKCWTNGEKFKPTTTEMLKLWEDFVSQELGTSSQIKELLDEEFGEDN